MVIRMGKARTYGITVLALIVVCLATDGRAKSPDLRIYYTSNVMGYIDQCACPIVPAGTITRRATYFSSEENGRIPALKLDGGEVVGELTPVGQMQTLYLFRAMQMMGYKTLGVGPRDFQYGLDFLRRVEREFGFTFTAVNVAGRDGEPVFAPWVVERVRGRRFLGIGGPTVTVGIICVMGQDRPPLTISTDPDLTVHEPIPAVRNAVAELRDKTDVIVLMAYVNPADLEVLMHIDGVDVVIMTRLTRPPQGWIVKRGDTVVGYSSVQGQTVGRIEVYMEDGRMVDGYGEKKLLRMDIAEDPDMLQLREEFARWKLDEQSE